MLNLHEFLSGLPVVGLAGLQCSAVAVLLLGLFLLGFGLRMYGKAKSAKEAAGSPILIMVGGCFVILGAAALSFSIMCWATLPPDAVRVPQMLRLGVHSLVLGIALAVVGSALYYLVRKAFPNNDPALTLPIFFEAFAIIFIVGGLSAFTRAGLSWL